MNLVTYFIDSVKNRGYGSFLVQAMETPRGAPALVCAVLGQVGLPRPQHAATATSLKLRHSRSPLHQASFPLPSPGPWPNTHTLSCQRGHSCLRCRRQGRHACQVYAKSLQIVNAHQDLSSSFGAPLYCKGVR